MLFTVKLPQLWSFKKWCMVVSISTSSRWQQWNLTMARLTKRTVLTFLKILKRLFFFLSPACSNFTRIRHSPLNPRTGIRRNNDKTATEKASCQSARLYSTALMPEAVPEIARPSALPFLSSQKKGKYISFVFYLKIWIPDDSKMTKSVTKWCKSLTHLKMLSCWSRFSLDTLKPRRRCRRVIQCKPVITKTNNKPWRQWSTIHWSVGVWDTL